MAPESCTVAVDIEDHHITIHFKSDDQVRNIYVHPDNVVLTSNTRSWAQRRGGEYQVMATISDEIGMSTSLWTKIKSWVASVVLQLMQLESHKAVGKDIYCTSNTEELEMCAKNSSRKFGHVLVPRWVYTHINPQGVVYAKELTRCLTAIGIQKPRNFFKAKLYLVFGCFRLFFLPLESSTLLGDFRTSAPHGAQRTWTLSKRYERLLCAACGSYKVIKSILKDPFEHLHERLMSDHMH
ncbi:uncharacterized protein LACBIDRAFT_296006 [Laccaria bicolor S238N-H82]|uniref:Predicted protein n=1 Tax=Laccaria bicolor (strain S238N-H82 / ATCC MYA-4686) TaxID=486041 RepID=B0E1P5_LACBS|nr:uncharacterized protein LACBIDRAFT_296006 [Laccaria bicolor S238N-H82]EDQ99209.1 predicted protein [Laccaria bicolor S238N-H82]|eukprot:XP_001890106.1 predicted protein [Laccaria bicolor S238N-H82]